MLNTFNIRGNVEVSAHTFSQYFILYFKRDSRAIYGSKTCHVLLWNQWKSYIVFLFLCFVFVFVLFFVKTCNFTWVSQMFRNIFVTFGTIQELENSFVEFEKSGLCGAELAWYSSRVLLVRFPSIGWNTVSKSTVVRFSCHCLILPFLATWIQFLARRSWTQTISKMVVTLLQIAASSCNHLDSLYPSAKFQVILLLLSLLLLLLLLLLLFTH